MHVELTTLEKAEAILADASSPQDVLDGLERAKARANFAIAYALEVHNGVHEAVREYQVWKLAAERLRQGASAPSPREHR